MDAVAGKAVEDLPLMNWEEAMANTEDDVFVLELLIVFFHEALPRLRKLLTAALAYRRGETELVTAAEGVRQLDVVVKDEGHAIKGSAANLRLWRLAKAAEIVEHPFKFASEEEKKHLLAHYLLPPAAEIAVLLREFRSFAQFMERDVRSNVDPGSDISTMDPEAYANLPLTTVAYYDSSVRDLLDAVYQPAAAPQTQQLPGEAAPEPATAPAAAAASVPDGSAAPALPTAPPAAEPAAPAPEPGVVHVADAAATAGAGASGDAAPATASTASLAAVVVSQVEPTAVTGPAAPAPHADAAPVPLAAAAAAAAPAAAGRVSPPVPVPNGGLAAPLPELRATGSSAPAVATHTESVGAALSGSRSDRSSAKVVPLSDIDVAPSGSGLVGVPDGPASHAGPATTTTTTGAPAATGGAESTAVAGSPAAVEDGGGST